MTELIGRTTRGIFRDLTTGSTVGAISAAFQDEGFAPNPDCTHQDSGVRRSTTQAYLEAVDWTDPAHVTRFLRVAERLLHGWEPQYLVNFWQSLRRDGYDVDNATGQISTLGPRLTIESLAKVTDPSAIREQMDRIRRSANDDPALAIGTAKELVESTAKVVLLELGQSVDDRADLPELAKAAQLALGLHPSAATGSSPDSSDGVKRILGAVTTIANGLAELRNRGHGTGHGPATARVGLRPRDRPRRPTPPPRTPRRQRRLHLVPADARHPCRPRSAMAADVVTSSRSALRPSTPAFSGQVPTDPAAREAG